MAEVDATWTWGSPTTTPLIQCCPSCSAAASDAHPAALVGVGDGAAVLEAPVSRCGDGAVYPARSRRRAGHDARFVLIEARGHLHHHGDVDATGAVVVVGEPFFTGDPARVERGIPVHVDVRAVQGGVAAVEDGIHE